MCKEVGPNPYQNDSPVPPKVVFAASLSNEKGKEKEKGRGKEEPSHLLWYLENQ